MKIKLFFLLMILLYPFQLWAQTASTDAGHDAACGGRRPGRLAAGALRRRHGARPRSQGVDVDLRRDVAAEPPEPQRNGQLFNEHFE